MLKAFITNLGKYNEGYLIGEWIEFPISKDTITVPIDTAKTSKPFESTLNKYISKYENQQQLSYNSNTPYDKASKQLEESIVLGMNIDLQV